MNWDAQEMNNLAEAVLNLKTRDEARRFLRDLMTEAEIREFAKRFEAARLLSENTPYSRIEEKTGLSSTTIARVSKWLNGKEEGYKTVLARMFHHTPSHVRRGLS